MKNLDPIGSGYSAPKNYNHEQLMRIVKDIDSYKKVLKEDVVILSKAADGAPNQELKYTYSKPLRRYYNKDREIQKTLDKAEEILLSGFNKVPGCSDFNNKMTVYLVNDILNAIISQLEDNKPIATAIQVELIEALRENRFPALTSTIFVILYKIFQKQDDYNNFVNLAESSIKLISGVDTSFNRNVLKITEEVFNKTNILVEGARESLIKLAVNKEATYRLREQSLDLLLKAAANNTDLGNIELLKSNTNNEIDSNLQIKLLKIIETVEAKTKEFLLSKQSIAVEEDESIKLERELNEEIILLTKKVVSLEKEEQSIELDKLVDLTKAKVNLPLVIAEDICTLITEKFDSTTDNTVLILNRLVEQGAKVELATLKRLAGNLFKNQASEETENNIIDILSRNIEFTEFISEFNNLKRQNKTLLDPLSSDIQKEAAAKFLSEYSKNRPLPLISLTAVKKGLEYSTSSSHCIKALATNPQKIELSAPEIELIIINSYDPELAQAAKNILLHNGIDSSLGNTLVLEQGLQSKLAASFPNLNVTNIIAAKIEENIVSLKWGQEFSEELLAKITINNFAELDSFLDFVSANSISKEEVTSALDEQIPIKHLERKISKARIEELVESDVNLLGKTQEFKDNLIKLIDRNWSLTTTSRLVNETNSEDQIKLLEGIKLVNDYTIKEDQAASVFFTFPASFWGTELHKIAIATSNVSGIDKKRYVLFKELTGLNKDNSKILELIDSNYLNFTLTAVTEAYKKDSVILPQGKAIKEWQPQNISAWSKIYKKIGQKQEELLPEVMAVINRTNYLHTNYEVRPIQMIAVLSLLKPKAHGRLLQIATGEGKSTITAMLATIHALDGEYVDVITSSPVLARRDREEKVGFFRMFELSCGHNTERTTMEGVKSCYKDNIVYGDVSSYQFDLLSAEYKRYGTRSDRPFGIAIVDEVDSMLIDEGGKIAKISSPISGMEYLEPLLVAIWQQLGLIQSKYTYLSSSEQLLWINGEFSNDNDELYLLGDTTEDDIRLVDDHEKFTNELLEDYITSLLQNEAIAVPPHLHEFINFQAKYWAKSAIFAMYTEENRHYVIKEDEGVKKITPVDYAGTGVIQNKTQWTDGLHQFLEIKHGLKIKPESLTTCFISNMGYFNRYGNKIYGMTGTLGSQSARELLKSSYNLDFGFIPSYRPKRFYELIPIIERGKSEWLETVSDNAIREANSGRSCLIISETIADSIDIEKTLREKGYPRIINYYHSDDLKQSAFLEHELGCGTIIVATNLAGRGTDIKTSTELENKGGLHVSLTFLPTNLRVEQQAFGRTSRQGNIGSGQLIINGDYELAKLRQAYPDYNGKVETVEQLRIFRDLVESKRIADIQTNQVPKLILEDGLFNQFKNLAHSLLAQENNKYKLLQLEELWGLHFKHLAHEKIYSKELELKAKEEFVEFSKKTKALYSKGNSIISNPAYLIRQAVDKMSSYDYVVQSIDLLKEALALNDKFNYGANYYLAFSILKHSGSLNNANPEQAAEAAGHLNTAREQIIDYIIPVWESMLIMLGPSYNGSILGNQIFNKIELLQKTVSYIDSGLSVINSSSEEQIVRVKNQALLDSLYPSQDLPKEEILELNIAGVNQVYEVEAVEVEKEPKGWFSNFAIAVIGIAQIIVGITLTLATAGGGVQLSSAIILEGIKDIYNAVKATITDTSLDLKDYWNDKGISYAIVVATAGIQSIKASMAKQAALKTGEEVATTTIKEVAQQSLKEKFIEVGKEAALTIIAQEGGLALARGISGALGNFRNEIKKDAISEVRRVLEQPHLAEALSEIIAIDKFYNSNLRQRLLIKKIEDVLKPHENKFYNISKRLVNSLSGSFNSLKLVGTVIEVAGYAEAIEQFNSILDKFCVDLKRIILEIQRELPTTQKLLGDKLSLSLSDQEKLKDSVERLKQAGIMTGDRSFNGQLLAKGFVPGISQSQVKIQSDSKQEHGMLEQNQSSGFPSPIISGGNIMPFQFQDINQIKPDQGSLDGMIDFGSGIHNKDLKQRAIAQIRHLHTAYAGDYSAERKRLIQNLGQSVSSNIIRKLNTGLIQPASSIVASTGIRKISTLLAEHNKQVRIKLLSEQTRTVVIKKEPITDVDSSVTKESIPLMDKERKLAQVKIHDIERTLGDRYPGLSVVEQRKLAQEVYMLEREWQKNPSSRPGIMLASNGSISSDMPFVLPSARSQAIGIALSNYSNESAISANGGKQFQVVDNSNRNFKTTYPYTPEQLESMGSDSGELAKFVKRVGEILANTYQASLAETDRQRGTSSFELFEQRNRELNLKVSAIRHGEGHEVFKFFNELNQIVGGTLRYSVEQPVYTLNHILHMNAPRIMAASDAVVGTMGHGIGHGLSELYMTLPEVAKTQIAQAYMKYTQVFPTENERFLLGLSTGPLLGKLVLGGVRLAASNSNKVGKLTKAPAISEMEMLNYVYQRNGLNLNQGIGASKLNTSINNKIIPYKVNNELPRNIVQERLGGYYEGLSVEHVQLQRQAEDLLLREKFKDKVIKDITGNEYIFKGSIREQAALEIMQVLKEEGKVIAGVGRVDPIKDISRLVRTYGGMESDWVKKSSRSINKGTLFDKRYKQEIHWYENIKTGEKFELKIKKNPIKY